MVIAPPPRLIDPHASATPEELKAAKRESVDRMVNWVRANNRWRPDADVATHLATRVEKSFSQSDGFAMMYGGGLLRSGKPMLVIARTGGFFLFELTPEQATSAGLTQMGQWDSAYNHAADPRCLRPRIALSDFRIPDADSHPPAGRLDVSITCEFPEAPGPESHLQLTHYHSDGRRTLFRHFPKPMPTAGRTVLHFSANPLEPRTRKNDRLVAVFAEWVSGAGVIESNTAATLVLLNADR